MESAEHRRINEKYQESIPWMKWGPYLSERQWGTVREDYSDDGNAWDYFPHEHARSRAYRWGEDGIAGISDELQNLCFSLCVWNHKDPILKERLFGLNGHEGNHGEDVKELYYYLENTPTHSYMKYLYKYPIDEYPYADLLNTNQSRSKDDPEYELLDTNCFKDNRYFDIFVEYAKAGPDDIFIKITVENRSDVASSLSLLPTIWFRNKWSFGKEIEKPIIEKIDIVENWETVVCNHPTIGEYNFYYDQCDYELFTENETNNFKVFGIDSDASFKKDYFHELLVNNKLDSYSSPNKGTKFSPLYQINLSAKESKSFTFRLSKKRSNDNPFKHLETVFKDRISEKANFYSSISPDACNKDIKMIQEQAYSGMLWSKQFYHIDMEIWLNGDKGQPQPPNNRLNGRNKNWRTLNNEDIVSMPDKWEYPWYAAWDLAFHCITLAEVDPSFAKEQLILIMREWYMAPNGQIPAYEWNFSDVNPPVHAWAAYKIYKIDCKFNKEPDINFLKRIFQKLMLNFTWWVNRKDSHGKNVFEGGFLGLDNIGVFDRSQDLPDGGKLEQADGTSWMAMFSLYMMKISIEICKFDPSFEDVSTKFFEHFVYISESINQSGKNWTGAWDEEDGLFYDVLQLPNDEYLPIKVRSLVGLTPLFAITVITKEELETIPDFMVRLKWFYNYRRELNKYSVIDNIDNDNGILFSMVNEDQLRKLIKVLLDETEFLAPGGIRSLSKIHKDGYSIKIGNQDFSLSYQPGESNSDLFGGNSNWRGPIWMPMNYLLIHSLREYHTYYKDNFKMEFPTGSNNFMNLEEIADELSKRLISIFQIDNEGKRPVNGDYDIYKDDHFKNLILFPEYMHGDTSRAVGASHQTGWTGLVATLINECKWNKK
ncbi:MGH1-like glycoside hydrolase domain-containing protein [Aureibacter tunicatorum]|uniref:Glucosidase n=1 Tax=Aureibacter tunicatorum TaxID=866807 RepID=A0AAE3XQV0_9BACT|nr:glucosidase [Aureibacter tunicatorum]MDR6239734.1 hypothetical protein [Aureibacter tunicatorum]BDD04210.1 glucosidase [Aureibacter tunicatorum]